MKVIERLVTICGETQFAGLPCALIRFAGCDLRCTWCDTVYAREHKGEETAVDELLQWVRSTKVQLVLLTGGEPLLQNDLTRLAVALADSKHTVLVETSGAYDIGVLPPPIIRAMDIKCPGSGESERILWSNLEQLRPEDAVKMVLTSREDYDYAKAVIQRYRLGFPLNILLSSAYPRLECKQLADWMVEDRLGQVRLNVQLHRILWPTLG